MAPAPDAEIESVCIGIVADESVGSERSGSLEGSVDRAILGLASHAFLPTVDIAPTRRRSNRWSNPLLDCEVMQVAMAPLHRLLPWESSEEPTVSPADNPTREDRTVSEEREEGTLSDERPPEPSPPQD